MISPTREYYAVSDKNRHNAKWSINTSPKPRKSYFTSRKCTQEMITTPRMKQLQNPFSAHDLPFF